MATFVEQQPVFVEAEEPVEVDYRWFQYSRFALPWLLFMLSVFVTLLCLTIWQGGFHVKEITEGIPRDLEPYAKADTEAGLKRPTRNLRFCTAVLAIVPPFVLLLTYYFGPHPARRKLINNVCAVVLFVAAILAVIAFSVDVGKTDDAVRCKTSQPGATPACESRKSYAVAVTVLDLAVAALAAVTAVMVFLFTAANTFKPELLSFEDEEAQFEEPSAKPVIPGQSTVHKSLIFFGAFALIIAAALLLIFTIFLHENRERVVGPVWDPISRQAQSGWPRQNTRLRLAASAFAAALSLLSLVPWGRRVYAYLLAFGFFAVSVMFFVAFGLDVKDLKDARDLQCPTTTVQSCIYHPYNTTVLFDFLCGLIAIVYVFYEFVINHKNSFVERPQKYVEPPTYPTPVVYEQPKMLEAPVYTPATRPFLGVEVVEAQDGAQLLVNVVSVTPGGPAEAAGLRAGDTIARWDEMTIGCKADFAVAVQNSAIGQTVVLQVLRKVVADNGDEQNVIEYARLTIQGVSA